MADRSQSARRIDKPEPGYFVTRLVKRGPRVAARIWQFDDGAWAAEVNGERVGNADLDPELADGVMRIWHYADRSTHQEYCYLISLKEWAEKHDKAHPAANPRKPIDLNLHETIF